MRKWSQVTGNKKKSVSIEFIQLQNNFNKFTQGTKIKACNQADEPARMELERSSKVGNGAS